MIRNFKTFSALALIAFTLFSPLTSCNKSDDDEPQLEDMTVGEIITADPNYSLFKLSAEKAGLMPYLSDAANHFTLFLADNAAFSSSEVSPEYLNTLPAGQIANVLNYHIIPSEYPSSNIPDSFPNAVAASRFQLPGAPGVVYLNLYPSRMADKLFVNEVSITHGDIKTANGYIHEVGAIISPPLNVLYEDIKVDTNLTYFIAAMNRTDLGLPLGSRFWQLFQNPNVNLTLFLPNNAAFQTALTNFGYGTDISEINKIPLDKLIALVAYHIHIKDYTAPSTFTYNRIFTVNFPVTPTAFNTYLKVISPTAPQITLQNGLGVKGALNTNFSKAVRPNKNSINGVYHVINQVLLPA